VTWVLVGLCCAALAVALAAFVIAPMAISRQGGQSLATELVSVAILGAGGVGSAIRAREAFADAAKAVARSWTGTLECQREPKRLEGGLFQPIYDFDYFVRSAGRRWPVPYRLYCIFEDGVHYRVFHAPESPTPLSIEALGTPDASAPHHHRSTDLMAAPGSTVPMIASACLAVLILAVAMSAGNLPVVVVTLAALGVVGLFFTRTLPFFLALPLVISAFFFALLAFSIQMG
jgi:hypothetical protein